ncbi:MAG: tRNA (N(6)-L-threonylcarbamoyladenosine(37)-C(2))-methylthiotransferase MtaB [Pelosinus sp.]|nr:tRNA (N(6)-L-threonylcarbamoyladenosine(37)-C(2))-methylthiotransferase MtaB [Pelosinus sp.]
MMRAAFTTLGCKVNQYETETMEGLFKERGYSIVAFDEYADVYIINTCSVTHLGEKKSRQLIRRAVRLNAQAVVAVTGCYAQVSPEEVAGIEGVDIIVGTKERHRIVDLVEEVLKEHKPINIVSNIMDAKEFEDIPLFSAPGRTRAFLKIQEGCTNFCTYCIIPYARGPLRSRGLASIAEEAHKLVELGFKEIVLTGIHLGAYGRDLNEQVNLVDAVKTVLAEPGLVRLRLGSLESIELSPKLLAVMQQDERFCQFFHLPLQAGDNQVLEAMNRQYTTAEYQDLIESIRTKLPDAAISTDLIVGFPGETEAMFQNTVEFVQTMNFAKMHIFPFSPRQGTPAAEFANQISEETKKQRAHYMQVVAEQNAQEYQTRFIGKNMQVLFETEQNGIVDGLTGNYLRIYTAGSDYLTGTVHRVLLEKLYRDGLWGKIID